MGKEKYCVMEHSSVLRMAATTTTVALALLVTTLSEPVGAAVKIGGIVNAGQSRTKELLEEILKERSSNLPTQIRMHSDIAYVEANSTFGTTNTACAQVGQGVSAIVSPCTGDAHTALLKLSKRIALPYINTAPDLIDYYSKQISPALSDDTSDDAAVVDADFSIVMAPSTSKATADLIRKNKWKDIYFVYDKPKGLEELELILAELPKEDEVEVKGAHYVTSNTSAMNYLAAVENAAWDVEKHFILAVDIKMAKRLIELSFLKKRAYSHFIIPRFTVRHFWSEVRTFDQSTVAAFQVVDEVEFRSMKGLRAGVSTPKNPEDEHINEEEAFLMDAGQLLSMTMQAINGEQPAASQDIFRELSQITASISCYQTPLEEYQHGQIITDVLKKARFKGSTGQVRFDSKGRRTGYSFEILELTSTADMEKVGTWSDQEGLRFSNEHERQEKRARTKEELSRSILITTTIQAPFLFFKSANDSRPHIDNVDGYIKELIVRLMAELPGRPAFDIHLTKDGRLGGPDPRVVSGWNGLIGDVLRKDADLAVGPLTITASRASVVRFSRPFMASAVAAAARNDADDLLNVRTPFAFGRPLDARVWLLLVAAYLAVAVVLLVINLLNVAVATPPRAGAPCRHFYNALWYAFGMFMSEECNNCRPKSLGSRVIACSWWIFILCILSIYTAQLWINEPFTLVANERMPQNLKELLYQDEIEYGFVRGSATEDFFMTTDDPEYRAMYLRALKFNDTVVDTYVKAIDRVRNSSSYVVFADSNLIRYTAARNPCDIVKVGNDVRRGQYGIAMSKHFALRKKIDDIITSLREEGFLQALEQRWFGPQNLDCPLTSVHSMAVPSVTYGLKTASEAAHPLGVRRVLGWFVVLAFGLIVALFITICEVYCKTPKKVRSPEEIAQRQAAREAKKAKQAAAAAAGGAASKGKTKDKVDEVETQQLTAHEAPIGNSQMEDSARFGVGMAISPTDATSKAAGCGGGAPGDDATLKKRGLPREKKIDEEYPADAVDGRFRKNELPPIADVEPFTDTDSRVAPHLKTMTLSKPSSKADSDKQPLSLGMNSTLRGSQKPPVDNIINQSTLRSQPHTMARQPLPSPPSEVTAPVNKITSQPQQAQPNLQTHQQAQPQSHLTASNPSEPFLSQPAVMQSQQPPPSLQTGVRSATGAPQSMAGQPLLGQRVPPVQLPPSAAALPRVASSGPISNAVSPPNFMPTGGARMQPTSPPAAVPSHHEAPPGPRTPSPAPAGPPLPTSTLPSMSPVGPITPLSSTSPVSPVSPNALPPAIGGGFVRSPMDLGGPPPRLPTSDEPSPLSALDVLPLAPAAGGASGRGGGPLSRMEFEGQPELKSIDRSPTETSDSPPDDFERIDPILGNLANLANLPPPPAMRPTIQNQDSIGYESSDV